MNTDSRKSLLRALASLRAAYQLHQDAHWQVQGTAFYGKHLLLQRLYEETQPLVDGLAERMVGMGVDLTEPAQTQEMEMAVIEAHQGGATCPVAISLNAVDDSLGNLQRAYQILKDHNDLTLGTDDLLMATCSTLEEHQYLLQQVLKPDTKKLKARLLR